VTIFGESAPVAIERPRLSTFPLDLPNPRAVVHVARSPAAGAPGHHVSPSTRPTLERSGAAWLVDPTAAAAMATVRAIDALGRGPSSGSPRTSPDDRADPQRLARIALDAMPFRAVVDGDVASRAPTHRRDQGGCGGPIVVLVGNILEEYRLYPLLQRLCPTSTTRVLGGAAEMLSLDPDGLARLPRAVSSGEGLAAVLTMVLPDPAVRLAVVAPRHLGTSRVRPGGAPLEGSPGRMHALEIASRSTRSPSPGVASPQTPAPQGIATSMHAAWVGFATSGIPAGPRMRRQSRADE